MHAFLNLLITETDSLHNVELAFTDPIVERLGDAGIEVAASCFKTTATDLI